MPRSDLKRSPRGALFLSASLSLLLACTAALGERDPWPCEGDEDCDALHVCLRSSTGRFCQSPTPRCRGDNCGPQGPGLLRPDAVVPVEQDAEPPDVPDVAEPPPPPEDAGVAMDAAPSPPPPDATPPKDPDAAPPPPEECPLTIVDDDAVPGLTDARWCNRELPACVYEFTALQAASCDDFCALLDLRCVGARYNVTIFWCESTGAITVGCNDPDVRNLICECAP